MTTRSYVLRRVGLHQNSGINHCRSFTNCCDTTCVQVDEVTWKLALEAHPFLEKIVTHLSESLDLFVGIKTHRLNELWSPDDPKGFSKWMRGEGKQFFATGSCGLHNVQKKKHKRCSTRGFALVGRAKSARR